MWCFPVKFGWTSTACVQKLTTCTGSESLTNRPSSQKIGLASGTYSAGAQVKLDGKVAAPSTTVQSSESSAAVADTTTVACSPPFRLTVAEPEGMRRYAVSGGPVPVTGSGALP